MNCYLLLEIYLISISNYLVEIFYIIIESKYSNRLFNKYLEISVVGLIYLTKQISISDYFVKICIKHNNCIKTVIDYLINIWKSVHRLCSHVNYSQHIEHVSQPFKQDDSK